MSAGTSIEWTDATWNPVRGCTKVSPGCKHCYAERFAERFRGVAGAPYEQGFDLRLVPELIDLPRGWKKPRRVFVNSMSDLFHEDVPDEYIQRVFAVMRDCPQHSFQVLTKRSERLAKLDSELEWAPNIWMGVSVESADYMDRIDHLLETNAALKFVSAEPLLGPLPSMPPGIGWVIVGGESGPGARDMKAEWVRPIRDQCLAAHVPFHFKQWGGVRKKLNGRVLDGRVWDQFPG
jgi:protein gp37